MALIESNLNTLDKSGDIFSQRPRDPWKLEGEINVAKPKVPESPTKKKSGHDYRFPDCEKYRKALEKLRRADVPQIVAFLDKAIGKIRDDAALLQVRPVYCAAHVALNEKGVMPPAFRPLVRCRRETLTENEKLLSNDLQVIDLHWLHLRHRTAIKPAAGERDAKKLYAGGDFNYVLAAQLTKRVGKTERKVEILGIPERLQIELGKLRTKTVRERLARIEKEVVDMGRRLAARSLDPASRFKSETAEERCLEFKCLSLAAGSPHVATEIYQQFTGIRLDRESASLRCDTLRKRKAWFETTFACRNWG